jgi:DNA-binding GntR family transcriptional regulator
MIQNLNVDNEYGYMEIYQKLSGDILDKVYKPGEKLLSENKLSSLFNVKRSVIRKVIYKLISDGLVFAIKNKGYYVRIDDINVRIHKDSNYTQNMIARGMTPKVRLLEIRTVSPSPHQKDIFNLKEGELLWYIRVLRYYKNIPYLIGESYIPFDNAPEFGLYYEKFMSIYKVFKEKYGILPQRKSSICKALISNKKESKLLSIFEHSPILRVESVNVDQRDNPVEQCFSTLRSDIVQLKINL